ncbi:MAG: DinB family protein [Anaerolineae bacterium]
MRKQELLDELKAARADFMQAVEGLSAEEMLRPSAVGIWSIKDVMAHLVAWESELITALKVAQNR